MRILRLILFFLLISAADVLAQEIPDLKVTPVDIDREKPPQPVLHYYDKHGEPLETPVRFLAELDTVTAARAGAVYPLFSGLKIGVNFFDAIMMIAGQKRGNFDLSATCSLWNWLMPTVEGGIGFSDSHPDDGRTYYKMRPSPYIKFGFNYNFLYKSDPAYQVYVGFRACYSNFTYDLPEIKPGSQYYHANGPAAICGLVGSCWYGEAVAGLEVGLYKGLAMGWSVRYGFNIRSRYSQPDFPAWYIPGRNASTPISATFSLIYRFLQRGSPKVTP